MSVKPLSYISTNYGQFLMLHAKDTLLAFVHGWWQRRTVMSVTLLTTYLRGGFLKDIRAGYKCGYGIHYTGIFSHNTRHFICSHNSPPGRLSVNNCKLFGFELPKNNLVTVRYMTTRVHKFSKNLADTSNF
jgi:hypothetical protein